MVSRSVVEEGEKLRLVVLGAGEKKGWELAVVSASGEARGLE
jgi:hypothetical protein